MNTNEESATGRAAKANIAVVGYWLLFGGAFSVLLSLFPNMVAADYLKEGGFNIGAAGIVLLAAEWRLRRETRDLIQECLDATLQKRFVEFQSAVFASVGNLLSSSSTAMKAEVASILETTSQQSRDLASISIRNALEAKVDESNLLFCNTIEAAIHNNLASDLGEIRNAVARKAVRDVLKATLASREELRLDLADHVAAIVEGLQDLSLRGDWAQDVYREYIGAVLANTRENAQKLCDVSVEKETSRLDDDRKVTLVSAAKRTDFILSRLMSKLMDGGRYSVVSDFGSWRNGQLSEFFDISLEVAARGGEIRRIFNLTQEVPSESMVSEVQAILKQHLDGASKYSGYKVKLLDKSSPNFISRAHFGIFERAGQDHCIRVRVEKMDNEEDLQILRFAKVPLVSDDMKQFERAWALLPSLDTERIESALGEWKKSGEREGLRF